MRAKAIIAVFGSSDKTGETDVLPLAERLGSTIAEKGHIVLTGGTGPTDQGRKRNYL